MKEGCRALIQLVVDKNPRFREMIRKDMEMEDTLMDILKDRVDERINESVNESTAAHLNALMEELGCTPERAMDLLHIPEQKRDALTALVNRHAR